MLGGGVWGKTFFHRGSNPLLAILHTLTVSNVGNMWKDLEFSSYEYFFFFHFLNRAHRNGRNTGLFEMIVGVLTTCHMQHTWDRSICIFLFNRTSFMFLLFPQVSRNWKYESEPPLKPSPLTCYKQFGTNSIIVLLFLESQRVHI